MILEQREDEHIILAAGDTAIVEDNHFPSITETAQTLLADFSLPLVELPPVQIAQILGESFDQEAEVLLAMASEMERRGKAASAISIAKKRAERIQTIKQPYQQHIIQTGKLPYETELVRGGYGFPEHTVRLAMKLIVAQNVGVNSVQYERLLRQMGGPFPEQKTLHGLSAEKEGAASARSFLSNLVAGYAREMGRTARYEPEHVTPEQKKVWEERNNLLRYALANRVPGVHEWTSNVVYLWRYLADKYKSGLLLGGQVAVTGGYTLNGFVILPNS